MALAPLAGMIGGPLLSGMGVGASIGLTASQLGAGVAGLTSLIQGNDPLTAGLDALGGYGGASGLSKLSQFGASQAASTAPSVTTALSTPSGIQNVAGNLAAGTDAALGTTTSFAPVSGAASTAPFSFSNVKSGLSNLMEPGGAQAFKDVTGSSVLGAVGVPAAGIAMSAMPTGPMGTTGEPSLGFGPFTPISERRRENMGYAAGGLADLNPMAGVFDARNAQREYGEMIRPYAKGGATLADIIKELQLDVSSGEIDLTPREMGLGPQIMGDQASGRIGYETPDGLGVGVRGSYFKPVGGKQTSGISEVDASYRSGANRVGVGYNPMSDQERYFYERQLENGALGVGYTPEQQAINFFLQKNFAKGGITHMENGGFVVPADVVSHLGNGSSDAGLKVLMAKLGARPIKGKGDGMDDKIPATIEGKQPARVANDEAYVPKAMVAKIGDGDVKRGARRLYAMMDKIRKARTGNAEQGREINPNKFVPA